ncbi:MAG: ATP-binding cassette domain-containing protein [Clostridiales Family XIII bacterium]|jgi:ABC-type polar amino acid transport system ATPase subunit|nr:ATP-binding cassette domain-containing protein [Clostridiales Family XIII bacterium]
MLKLQSIDYSINGSKILDDINFDAPVGKVTVLLGPSGAGKTTLLRCINALNVPDKGRILFNDREFEAKRLSKQDKTFLRKNISMVFQHYPLFHNKTVLDNIAEGLRIVHGHTNDDARKIAMDSLRQFHIADKAADYPARLSGGQRQRVSIARAISVNPKIILFDEPTSALDHELVDEVEGIVKDLAARKITIVIVTHEISFAEHVSDRVVFIKDGRIQAANESNKVFSYARL